MASASYKRPNCPVTTQTWAVDVAGHALALPIVAVDPPRLGIALMMITDLGVSFAERSGRALAARLVPLRPDVVVGAATLGVPVAIEVTRALGLDRYVALHKSPKVHLADALRQPVTSVTSRGGQALLLDRDAEPLLRGRRVAVVDDVVASGSSLAAALALVRRAGGHVVGAGVVLTEARAWEAALGDDAALVRGLAHIPQFRLEGDEWRPIESTF